MYLALIHHSLLIFKFFCYFVSIFFLSFPRLPLPVFTLRSSADGFADWLENRFLHIFFPFSFPNPLSDLIFRPPQHLYNFPATQRLKKTFVLFCYSFFANNQTLPCIPITLFLIYRIDAENRLSVPCI